MPNYAPCDFLLFDENLNNAEKPKSQILSLNLILILKSTIKLSLKLNPNPEEKKKIHLPIGRYGNKYLPINAAPRVTVLKFQPGLKKKSSKILNGTFHSHYMRNTVYTVIRNREFHPNRLC